MFVELAEMLGVGDKLNITMVALKDGQMSLTVVPQGDFSKQPALGAGMSLQATAQEFDAELPAVLTKFVKTRKSLVEQMDAQTLVLDAAKSAVVATTAKALATAQGGKGQAAPAKPGAAKAVVKVVPADGGGEDDDAGGDGVATPAAQAAAPVTGEAVELF